MRKSLFFAGLAAAALTLVGCNKEADVKGLDAVPCELILTNADTRTVNAGMSTVWAENDELNVFYAPAGTEDYSANTKFVVDDPETNHATGTAELLTSAYDWYLLYPYDSHIKTPANTSEGYLTLGSRSNGVQTQNGLDNMAHLAGKNLPVYGVAKNVASGTVPVISMKQVASVVAVNLTNDTEKALSVSTVSFTAPEDIVGTYYIDFSGDELSFKDSGSGYVSATANLSVSGGQTIAAGSSAKFYIAIKPFAAKAGDELKLTVLADQGEVEKTVTLSQACTFASGSIKTLNLSYEAPAVVPTITVADIKEAITSTSKTSPDSFTGQLAGAVVSFVSGSNAFIQDETGGILLYLSGHGLKAGDVLSGIVSGTGYIYKGLKEMISLTGFDKADGTVPEPVSLSLAQLLADYDAYVSVRVKVTGVTVPTSFSSRNTTMTNGDVSLALRDQKSDLTITPGSYDIVGYPSYFNDAQFGVWTQDDIIPVASDEKFFGVSQDQFDVEAIETSVQVNVTGNVDWTVEPGDGITSMEPAQGSGEGTVTITFPANTDTENTKEYSAFIRTAEPSLVDAGKEEFEITITQGKATPVTGPHFAKVMSTSDLADGKYLIVYEGGSVAMTDAVDQANNGTAVTITNNIIEATDENKALAFTITVSSGFIQAPNGKFIGQTSDANGMKIQATGIENTITVTDGDASIVGGGAHLRYNSNSDQKRFRYFKSSSYSGQKAIALYKLIGDGGDTPQPTHAGTVDDPFTVANALAATEALGEGKTDSDYSYTKGIVSKVDEISTDHGNATYYISDDGTTAEQFYVFRGKYIGKTNFTDENQLQVGDEVVVCGKLKNYKPQEGDAILELTDNYIHSLKRNGAVAYAFNASVSSTSASSGGATVKVNVFGNVNWTAAATGGATLEKSSGDGYSSFNVTIPANETTSEKTYTVTVSTTAAVSNSSITMTITQEAKGDGNQYVLDLTTATYSSASADQVVWDTPVMTITVNKAGAGTNANNYLGGSGTYTSSRFYKNSTVTFAPKSGVTVSTMVCSATSTNYATAFATSTWTNATAAANEKVVTVTPANGANAMDVTIGGVCGFTQIVINY